MDILVLSHLRWNSVYQRPQHLMTRAARSHRVLFMEEPMEADEPLLGREEVLPNLTVVRPTPEDSLSEPRLADVIERHVAGWAQEPPVVWHYSVMAEPLSRRLGASVTIYDCMDELAAFADAPPELRERERRLMERADLVFAGGYSLWDAKRHLHPRVHLFPSGVDLEHFGRALEEQPEPSALRGIGRPRLIYAGVIDERLDLGLLERITAAGIGELLLVGPVTKIDPADVPRGPRIHRLGLRPYDELPALFSHSDVALMPFARNAATRFISPTKTPEYLAAGLPVICTPIDDVVRGYGGLDGVEVAADAASFIDACERAVGYRGPSAAVREHLAGMSWDATWRSMEAIVSALVR